jgi:hypothetical protein
VIDSSNAFSPALSGILGADDDDVLVPLLVPEPELELLLELDPQAVTASVTMPTRSVAGTAFDFLIAMYLLLIAAAVSGHASRRSTNPH